MHRVPPHIDALVPTTGPSSQHKLGLKAVVAGAQPYGSFSKLAPRANAHPALHRNVLYIFFDPRFPSFSPFLSPPKDGPGNITSGPTPSPELAVHPG